MKKDDAGLIISKALRTISEQRAQSVSQIDYDREEDECLGCYQYDKLRVKGEETSLEQLKTLVRIGLKCPRCEKKWTRLLNKNLGWKKQYNHHARRFKQFQKSREQFMKKL